MRMLETLRSVVRFGRIETDPVERRLRPGRVGRRPAPHRQAPAARRRVRLHRRRRRGRAHARRQRGRASPRVDLPAAGAARRREGRHRRRRCSAGRSPYPLVLAPDRLHPHRRSRRASSPSRAPPPGPGCRTRCRRSAPARSRRCARSATAACGSRCTRGATAGWCKEMVDRAAAARYEALVLTVDTAVLGRRERDVRRGFSLPPTIGPRTLVDGALHPAWTWAFVRSEPIRFANVVGRDVGDGASPVTLSDYINTQFDPALSWDDVDWLRSVWDGPIVVKGIQTVDDAVLAADAGVDAIALSNHGGRQLDGAPAPFSLVAPGGRRGRRPHRDHLRRRRPAGQRHRQGRRRRRDRVHGRARLPLRPRRRRRARRRPRARRGSRDDVAAR